MHYRSARKRWSASLLCSKSTPVDDDRRDKPRQKSIRVCEMEHERVERFGGLARWHDRQLQKGTSKSCSSALPPASASYLPACLSVCLSLSACLPVRTTVCLYVCLSSLPVCLSACMTACLSVSLPVWLPICISPSLSASRPACLSVRLYTEAGQE